METAEVQLQPLTEEPGISIPDYELLRRIGRGAYGDVWLARNVLGQPRAVKLIYRSRFSDPRPFDREFEGIQRFEPISRSHPSQLAILHVGKNDAAGCFYYVMELADTTTNPKAESRNPNEARSPSSEGARLGPGPRPSDFGLISDSGPRPSDLYAPHTLRHDLESRGRLPISECVQIGLSLTTALAHLHENGLVHRDIKPSNVIFVKGVPKLGDIGLVTDAGDTQSIVGTEGYLPPDGPGTPRADIYSLGKVLYEISTGLDRRRFPELPEDMRAWPDYREAIEFNEIVLRACAADLGRRYSTAVEAGNDLAVLASGRSIRRKRQRQVAWRACQLGTAVLGLAGICAWLWHSVRPTAEPADKDRYVPSRIAAVNTLIDAGNYDVRGGLPTKLKHAEACFKEAIRLDPTYLPAYFGLSGVDIHCQDDAHIAELHATAEKMKQLDFWTAETQEILAFLEWNDGHWLQGLADAEKATHLPAVCKEGRAWAHGACGLFLQFAGEADAALAQYRWADKYWGSDPTIKDHLGQPLLMEGKLEEALQCFEDSLQLEPNHPNGLNWKARACEELNRFEEAIDARELCDRVLGRDGASIRAEYDPLRAAVRQDPIHGYWKRRLEVALQKSPPPYYSIATLYARLGNKQRAFENLEEAVRHQDRGLVGLLFDRCWDHKDERIIALAKKIGLKR